MAPSKISLLTLEETDPNKAPVVVTPEMLTALVTQILGKVNERIAERIVNAISADSDTKHVPSAKAVFTLVSALTPGITYKTITGTGDINTLVPNPQDRTIYLQRDSADDKTWMMYIKTEDGWVNIGDTEVDLSNYFSKDDMEELAQALEEEGVLEDYLDGKITEATTAVEAKITELDTKMAQALADYVKSDELSDALATETEALTEALSDVFVKESAFNTKFSSQLTASKSTILGWITGGEDDSDVVLASQFASKFTEQLNAAKSTIEGWATTIAESKANTAKAEAIADAESKYVKETDFSEKFSSELEDSYDDIKTGIGLDTAISGAKNDVLSTVQSTYLKTADLTTKLSEEGPKGAIDGMIDEKLATLATENDAKYVKASEFNTKFSAQLTASKETVDGWIDTKVGAAKNEVLETVSSTYVTNDSFSTKFSAALTESKSTVEGWAETKAQAAASAMKDEVLDEVEETYLAQEDFSSKFEEAFGPKKISLESTMDSKDQALKTSIMNEVAESYVADSDFASKFDTEYEKKNVAGAISSAVGAAKTEILGEVAKTYVTDEGLEDKINELLGGGDEGSEEGSLTETVNDMIDTKVEDAVSELTQTIESTYIKKEELAEQLDVVTSEQIQAAVLAAFNATKPDLTDD